jgi:D-glycero-beta-D-manno-heptose 1-phosphate adenylyltransferase
MNRNPETKIFTLPEAVSWREKLREAGRRLVVTNGCFDILHRGHAEYMHRSRALGDALLILINSDSSIREIKGPDRPIIDQYSRAYMLAALESIDGVVMFSTPQCNDLFIELKPDIYVKGGDYTLETLDATERAALQSVNAEIKFIPFIEGFSTTDIVNKINQTNDE